MGPGRRASPGCGGLTGLLRQGPDQHTVAGVYDVGAVTERVADRDRPGSHPRERPGAGVARQPSRPADRRDAAAADRLELAVVVLAPQLTRRRLPPGLGRRGPPVRTAGV